MSGHSKWHSIKHKKAATDAKRGKAFSKVIKEITIAARLGGGDPAANARLRTAIQNAKAVNMPQDNVTRAIKKGTGELPGVSYEEMTYEGYGPGGAAIMLEIMTDNKNRTVADIRHIFSKHNGNLGESGCVSWMFNKKALIVLPSEGVDEDRLMEVALEAGADDISLEGDVYEVTTDPEVMETVKDAVEKAGFPVSSASITMIPKTTIKLEGKQAVQMLKMMDTLEEHDDVQNVYANFDIDENIMNSLEDE
ncbi:YebC/PmpR family DNA-binding transcriptional regulator [bacterium]|nr:YebC/PmpR family DNA-binding transcriptional regulator [bacterium]